MVLTFFKYSLWNIIQCKHYRSSHFVIDIPVEVQTNFFRPYCIECSFEFIYNMKSSPMNFDIFVTRNVRHYLSRVNWYWYKIVRCCTNQEYWVCPFRLYYYKYSYCFIHLNLSYCFPVRTMFIVIVLLELLYLNPKEYIMFFWGLNLFCIRHRCLWILLIILVCFISFVSSNCIMVFVICS